MSRIHLIAPSGYCINQSAALRGIQRLTDAGHRVENQQVITRRDRRFAGDDAERLADLNALVTLDTPNTIVMPVRGGYGASRLLEGIDWQGLAERQRHAPLLICGHSDFTAVQLGLLATDNVITFSGPMLAANFGAEALDDFTQEHFWRALRNETFSVTWEGTGPACDVEGTLWGGNLALLVSLIGTPWLPTIENGILVVEDINEHPFRVERMLLQLQHAGILSRQKALILGSFSRSAPNDYDAGFDLDAMIAYLRTRLAIPVVSGLAFGHEPQTVTLPLGAQARLQHQDFHTQLTLSGHPVLSE
ncbi:MULTISPECIES: muramoyltetrapeptide carboxypeptidase [Pseudescherichia]|uniref:muramoyltetrapeptide carboxypeptidase n=1 Tax=Pseudescherichia TaxID=2055880 RepID=UPI0028AA8A73|nr:muramoyltetrapeptide carboxypeptidase [Pseudescherichia sp.]